MNGCRPLPKPRLHWKLLAVTFSKMLASILQSWTTITSPSKSIRVLAGLPPELAIVQCGIGLLRKWIEDPGLHLHGLFPTSRKQSAMIWILGKFSQQHAWMKIAAEQQHRSGSETQCSPAEIKNRIPFFFAEEPRWPAFRLWKCLDCISTFRLPLCHRA